MAWGSFGGGFAGGAQGSNNYMPDFNPYTPREPDPVLTAARNRARDFAADTTYNAPNGKVVTSILDPFSGDIRQLIEESRRSRLGGEMALQNNAHNLQLDQAEHQAALHAAQRMFNQRHGIVG